MNGANGLIVARLQVGSVSGRAMVGRGRMGDGDRLLAQL